MAVAEQFSAGVPSEAALLQSLGQTDKKLQGVETIHVKENLVQLYELDKKPEEALAKIRKLEAGVYKVSMYHHQMAYVKLSEKEAYLFDPTFGLITLEGDSDKQLLNEIKQRHYRKGDIHSFIQFERQSLLPSKIVIDEATS